MVQENNEQRNATERRSEAALWPDGEALPVLDAALQQLRLSLPVFFVRQRFLSFPWLYGYGFVYFLGA
jgi:hypothetical protein